MQVHFTMQGDTSRRREGSLIISLEITTKVTKIVDRAEAFDDTFGEPDKLPAKRYANHTVKC